MAATKAVPSGWRWVVQTAAARGDALAGYWAAKWVDRMADSWGNGSVAWKAAR